MVSKMLKHIGLYNKGFQNKMIRYLGYDEYSKLQYSTYLRQDEFLGQDEYEFQGKMNKVFFTKYIRSSRNNKVLRGT